MNLLESPEALFERMSRKTLIFLTPGKGESSRTLLSFEALFKNVPSVRFLGLKSSTSFSELDEAIRRKLPKPKQPYPFNLDSREILQEYSSGFPASVVLALSEFDRLHKAEPHSFYDVMSAIVSASRVAREANPREPKFCGVFLLNRLPADFPGLLGYQAGFGDLKKYSASEIAERELEVLSLT